MVLLFSYLISLVCSSLAAESALSSLKAYPKAKWTIAVYMNGDNELEDSITGGTAIDKGKEIELPGDFHYELATPGSNVDVHIVALVDRSPEYASNMDNWTNSRLYYVGAGDYPDNTRGTYWVNGTDHDELNMADANTLTWFIQTVQTNFPSDHLYLSLWDHNWGWHAGWFQKDETSNSDTMDYTHMYAALNESKSNNQLLSIDVVGYDACVAAQIEVMHTWRPFAGSFVGSQDYVGWGGVDYSIVASALQQQPDMSPADLTRVVASSMLTDRQDHCASAFALSDSFDALVGHVDTLALLLIQHIDDIRERLVEIREQTPQTPNYPSDEFHRDLCGMATGIAAGLAEYTDIVTAASDITQTFDAAVLYNKVSQRKVAHSCTGGMGMTIYWTKSGKHPSVDYLTTSFALATHWDEFLKVF